MQQKRSAVPLAEIGRRNTWHSQTALDKKKAQVAKLKTANSTGDLFVGTGDLGAIINRQIENLKAEETNFKGDPTGERNIVAKRATS